MLNKALLFYVLEAIDFSELDKLSWNFLPPVRRDVLEWVFDALVEFCIQIYKKLPYIVFYLFLLKFKMQWN